jgi:NAD(P)H-dependent flavin oxidoreductase YrpB (nitropropane dioxygenase family)
MAVSRRVAKLAGQQLDVCTPRTHSALGLGALAVSMGTRCLAREKALAPQGYQARARQSMAEDFVVAR